MLVITDNGVSKILSRMVEMRGDPWAQLCLELSADALTCSDCSC